MPRVSENVLSADMQARIWSALLRAFGASHDSEKLAAFLDDLLTATEKVMLAKRLMIAVLIQKGYRSSLICNILKVSKATVNSVRRDLARAGKGYRAIFQEFKQTSRKTGILEVFDRLLSAVQLPVKGSRTSMRRWRSGTIG